MTPSSTSSSEAPLETGSASEGDVVEGDVVEGDVVEGAAGGGDAATGSDDLLVRPVPKGAWGLSWVGGLALGLLLVSAAEFGWRQQGQRPTASMDDFDLWSAERRRASSGDPKTIVILGKSRALLDLDLPTLTRRYPDHTVVQLALNGRGAYAVFADLVQDPLFKGRMLFSMTEADLTLGDADAQQPAVDRSRHIGPDALWNARLRAHVASRLVVRSPLLVTERIFDTGSRGEWPAPNFMVTEPDRFTHGDFSRANMDVVRGDVLRRVRRVLGRMGGMQTPTYPWTEHIRRVPPLVRQLRERGGDVVFIHLPVCDESEQFSARVWPKARFWNRFASAVQSEGQRTTLHYRDHGALRGFRCPDTSHLDEKDAPRFTGALLKLLERQGNLPKGVGVW